MAKKRNIPNTNISAKNIRDEYEKQNKALDELNDGLKEQQSSFSKIFNINKRILNTQREIASETAKINSIEGTRLAAQKAGRTEHANTKKALDKERNAHQKILTSLQREQEINNSLLSTKKATANALKNTLGLVQKLADPRITQSGFYKYLMESDCAIRKTNLELGLSGLKAEMLRDNFFEAAQNSAHLGATIKDLRKAQMGYADETGRARVLTSEMQEDIVKMGLGTGMGIAGASKLTGQFDLMGVSVKDTMGFTQDVVDTSERMGINTTKVFKKISANFKDLQKMTFQQGVKGFAEMATYAEKFKVSMEGVINSAEQARTLKGAVEMAAQLQVMGGEFAKSDPFELLFLSRNDPAAYTKKINEMTKGIVTWKKNADGSFEKYLSPADRDRLEAAGKAMGLQSGELITQARRMADITKMRSQMVGMGVNKEQRELIEGVATISENGTFGVQLGSEFKELNKLTAGDIDRLKTEQVSLEERAKQALTFDKVFLATINSLKTSLLPLLYGINATLDVIAPIMKNFTDFISGISKENKSILTFTGKVLGVVFLLSKTVGAIKGMGSFFGMGGGGSKSRGNVGRTVRNAGGAAKGGGGAAFGRGAGVGVAALGIGAGIGVAAAGISTLADSLKDLDVKKIRELNYILMTLGTTTLLTLGAGLFFVGKASEASIVGLAVLGATSFAIGAGIGVAAAGIGFMAEGFATLSGVDLSGVATDILAIGAAAGGGGFLAMFGIGGMDGTATAISSMASNAAGMKQVGDAFKNIGVVMNGNVEQLKEVKDIIESITSSKTSSRNPISQLANLLNKPLKVEFADKEVALDIQLSLDSDVIYNKTIRPKLNRIYDDTVTSQQKGYS